MINCTLREGTIVSIEGDRVGIRLDEREESETSSTGCRSCSMKNLCRSRTAAGMELTVRLDDVGGRGTGDRVRLAYRETNPALAAAIMFLPPLLGLMAGGFAAAGLFGSGDGVFLAGSLAGLAAGVLVTFAINRLVPSLAPKVELLPDQVPGK